MKKIKLSEDMRNEFIDYSLDRINSCSHVKEYNYLTKNILNKTFTFFLNHKLTVEENAKSYWYMNNQKNMECCGYSGYSINEQDNEEGMIWNLFHEIFCKAEWIARSTRDTWYQDVVKQTIGSKNYYTITA